ncbi:MAG: SPOR domain-containing protein [Deltaproteobacteria bacterium]|nr:SPOR domain-containing protein [Deltaproteobacteria bacterium]
MTIRFRCECGRVLMASDEQAGMEGQCPACGRVVQIPVKETPSPKETTGDLSGEGSRGLEPGQEGSAGIEELGEPEEPGGEEPEGEREERGWIRSSRFAMLSSIIVVVVVALVAFMVVRKEREPSGGVATIEKSEPIAETDVALEGEPVGARLEEEGTESLSQGETESSLSSSVQAEPGVGISTEEPVPGETEALPSEPKKPVVASVRQETGPPEAAKPEGTFTINIASFRKRESALRYVRELNKKGIHAFDWEVDLPQKGRWYRVSVGGFSSRQEAQSYADDLKRMGISDIFITRGPGAS